MFFIYFWFPGGRDVRAIQRALGIVTDDELDAIVAYEVTAVQLRWLDHDLVADGTEDVHLLIFLPFLLLLFFPLPRDLVVVNAHQCLLHFHTVLHEFGLAAAVAVGHHNVPDPVFGQRLSVAEEALLLLDSGCMRQRSLLKFGQKRILHKRLLFLAEG